MSDMVKVFVYGTLKDGGVLDYFPQAREECVKDVILDGYLMYSIGNHFPAITEGSGSVKGEVHTYPRIFLEWLDQCENEGVLYRREKVHIDGHGSVYVYIYNVNDLDRHEIIESGEWVLRY